MSKELNLNEAVEYLAEAAKNDGTQLEILALENKNFKSSFQKQKLDQFGFSTTQQIGLRVIKDGHEGLAYTEQFTPDILKHTLEEAKGNATLIKSDYEVELPSPNAHEEMKSLFNEELASIPVEQKLEGAKMMEQVALDRDARVQSLPYNGYTDFQMTFRLWNTSGVDVGYKKNGCFAYAYSLAKDGDDAGMALEAQTSRDFSKIDFSAIGQEAADMALRRLGAKQPQSGKYPVVLDKKVTKDLIGMITSYFSAKSVHEQLSPLKGKLGDKVFSSKLSFIDDPFYHEGWNSRPFDDEGSPSQRTSLVKEGVIENWLSNSVLAKKMNIKNTANATRSPESALGIGPSNFVIEPGDSTLEDLLKSHPKTVLITKIKGFAGFNAISGDFSLESEGELYENGEFKGALKNFVLSGNIIEMLANVEAVGKDVFLSSSSVISPALLVGELSIAGQ